MSVKIFFSYARKDKVMREELEKHFEVLRRDRQISIWHDREIQPGMEWKREIDNYLNSSDIVLLLISPNFMRSDYCYGIEMKRALERHKRREALVIPIILRPVDWTKTPIGELQALPTNGKPISMWRNRDEAYFNVVESIRDVVEKLNKLFVRRLPIYLLLDCSGSMDGEPLAEMHRAMKLLYDLLMADPNAVEIAYVSVLTFSTRANQYQITPLNKFKLPTLSVGGKKALGAALSILISSIKEDLVLDSAAFDDYRPLVFLLTNGRIPTDDYFDPLKELQELEGRLKPTIVALQCEREVDTKVLYQITKNVFLSTTVTSEELKSFIKYN